MICIFKEQIYFKLPITIVNILIILLIYYIIGSITQICVMFTNCNNSVYQHLKTKCFGDTSHIIILVVSVFNLIFFLLFSLAMLLYYNEIGTLSNANVKTRINCNYCNIAKIIIYVIEYIIENYTNKSKLLLCLFIGLLYANYPKKKGFISTCINSLGALIGSSYSLLGEKIINHNREKVIEREKEPYYREEIAKRSRYYFLFGMILLPIATAFSLILFF